MKAIILLGTIALGTSAAQAAGSDRFVQAGYIVDVQRGNAGALELTGRNPKTSQSFHISVDARNHVVGTWNGRAVDYVLGEPGSRETVALAGN